MIKRLGLLLLTAGLVMSPTDSVGGLKQYQEQDLSTVNLLINGGAEHGTNDWTASAGTLATDSSTPLFGRVSLTWNSAAASDTLVSSAYTLPDGFDGQQCMARIFYQYASGSAADYTLQLYDGTNVLASEDLSVTSTTLESFVIAPCPSSGSIKVRILSNANGGTLELDRMHLGNDLYTYSHGAILGDQTVDNNLITPSAAFGTPTGESYTWSRRGDKMRVEGYFKAGTVAASTASIDLEGYTFATAKMPAGTLTTAVGRYQQIRTSGTPADINTEGYNNGILFYDGSDTNTLFFAGTTASDQFVKVNGSTMGATSNGFVFWFEVPITDWTGSTTSVSFDKANRNGSLEYTGTTNCTWTTTSGTYAAFSADTDCPTPTLKGGNVSAPGTKIPGIVASDIRSGDVVMVIASGVFEQAGAGDVCEFQISDGTNTAGNGYVKNATASDDHINSVVGVFSYAAAATSVTYQVFGKRTSGTGGNCQIYAGATDNDFNMTVVRLSEIKSGISFSNMVASSATDGRKLVSAYITNSGTPAVSSQDGTWIDSITDNSTGNSTLNLTAGVFSAAPRCSCIVSVAAAIRICDIDSTTAVSTSAVRIVTGTDAGAGSDNNFYIMCVGDY